MVIDKVNFQSTFFIYDQSDKVLIGLHYLKIHIRLIQHPYNYLNLAFEFIRMISDGSDRHGSMQYRQSDKIQPATGPGGLTLYPAGDIKYFDRSLLALL